VYLSFIGQSSFIEPDAFSIYVYIIL